MTQTVLVLGPTGRFGRNAALAFENAGWNVHRFDRKTDDLDTEARGVQVIVNGWHPPYSKWAAEALQMQPAIHRAALANDATVIIPGNVYNFGETTPAPWSDTTPHLAQNSLGKIRIDLEQGYRDAGVRTIVLRAGDYLDTSASGNWFDKIMAPSLKKGVFTFPGQPEIKRAYGFLPDVARAAVALSEKRDAFPRLIHVPFPGFTLIAAQIAAHLANARGQDVRIKQMAWWPLRLAWPFMADIKFLFEMRYIWNTPHSLDGARFHELLPEFKETPVEDALRQAAEFVPLPPRTERRAIPAVG